MELGVSPRVYRLLLLAYPADFRREYGSQMTQVFRDCCRQQVQQAGTLGLLRVWFQALRDLVQTVPYEHLDNFGKENSVMNNLRRDLVAAVVCFAIVLMAFLTLRYARANQVGSLLLFGYALDAIVVTGLIGNLIVFILARVTRFNQLRTAFWTFLIINAVPALILALIGGRIDPQFNLGGVLIGYVVSFLFWYGVHWIRTQKDRRQIEA